MSYKNKKQSPKHSFMERMKNDSLVRNTMSELGNYQKSSLNSPTKSPDFEKTLSALK